MERGNTVKELETRHNLPGKLYAAFTRRSVVYW